MLPDVVRSRVQAALGLVRSFQAIGGGDVSHAARVETESGLFLVKWNAGPGGDSFEAEAEGLGALAEIAPRDLTVPASVLAQNRTDRTPGLLVLPWLDRGRATHADWRRFGMALAALHRASAPGHGYGWPRDNWIGSKPQRNGWAEDWAAFFGEKRLLTQAETVRQRGAWHVEWDAPLGRLVARIGEILPRSPSRSLLHGDLWAGNALPLSTGHFALIDPAVHVGHRESDLAMTELFGGFAPSFYEGYREAWPLESGYAERRPLYTLFHLINHLTHGPGYTRSVSAVLRTF
ncbi:MAG: fructosamine kinase family protein [Bacteroidota bacterium]